MIKVLGYINTWSNIKNQHGWSIKADPDCGPNKLEYPPGSTPLHQIFEEYAVDNQLWVDDFIHALEKMLNNGYAEYILITKHNQMISIFFSQG